jgi:hypothetical protein
LQLNLSLAVALKLCLSLAVGVVLQPWSCIKGVRLYLLCTSIKVLQLYEKTKSGFKHLPLY